MGFEDAAALIGIEAVYEDLAALGAGVEAVGRDGECEDGLVMSHPVGEGRRVCSGAILAGEGGGILLRVVCHGHRISAIQKWQ